MGYFTRNAQGQRVLVMSWTAGSGCKDCGGDLADTAHTYCAECVSEGVTQVLHGKKV